MEKLQRFYHYFSRTERLLWGISVLLILLSFLLFDRSNVLTLCASLIGVTSLIFTAKGNPTGQLLMVVFSLLYGVISWQFRYYGEMITYLCMTLPMALMAVVSWLRHPFQGNQAEVEIHRLTRRQRWGLVWWCGIATIVLGILLWRLNTPNLLFSILSVSTSFTAAYLTFYRSSAYAIAYAANDVALIVLWVLASVKDISFTPMIACFSVFLLNDVYAYISWKHREKRQMDG